MADAELGLKAQGACVTPLLERGCPGNATVDTLLKEVNSHLSENQARIEECVKELMEMCQHLSGVGHKFRNPDNALSYLSENRLLDKQMCYDLDSDALSRLLKNVLQTMERNPGCEEKVVAQLFDLAGSEGMALPLRVSAPDVRSQSLLSINAAVDSSEQEVERLWNSVCLRMRKFYSDALHALPACGPRAVVCWQRFRALDCLQALASFYPMERVWALYTSIRTQQLSDTIKVHFPHCASAKALRRVGCPAELSGRFGRLCVDVFDMMSRDCELVCCLFEDVEAVVLALSALYLESLTDIVSLLLDVTTEENPAQSNKLARQDKRRQARNPSTTKEMSKSPSDIGFLGHHKLGLPKVQSKSADNLLSEPEEEAFSDLQVMAGTVLEPMCHIVQELLTMEEKVSDLVRATTWEAAANNRARGGPLSNQPLKGVLKPQTKVEDISNAVFSTEALQSFADATNVQYGASQNLNLQLSPGLKVIEQPVEDLVQWSWRGAFSGLASDIAKSLEHEVLVYVSVVTQELQRSNSAMVMVPQRLVGGRLDYPAQSYRCVVALSSRIETLSVLAHAGTEAPFDIVKAAFVDVVSTGLKTVHQKILECCGETNQSISCLYQALSSLAYIRNQVLFYQQTLSSKDQGARPVFPALYRMYCDGVNRLSRQIVEHHQHILATALLMDADSQHWENSKDFYESERCSFVVQMWFYQLKAVRHDLWSVCPPRLAQTMYTSILETSLSLLCARYVRAKPSYKRTAQFRSDITLILLCVSDLLLYSANSVTHYLDPSRCNSDHFSIHISCCHLLAAMAIISAPIDNVYKVYKKGFKKKRSHGDEDLTKGHISQWLSWIRPAVFPLGKTRCDNLQTTSALHLTLCLLSTKPDISWTLLLQCLLMKDYTLPIMLLTNLALQEKASEDGPQSDRTNSTDKRAEATREIFRVFITFLLQCVDFPSALCKVMLPICERTNGWQVFDVGVSLAWSQTTISPWLSAMFDCLDSYIIRAIDPGLRVLLCRHHEPVGREPITLRLKNLPCGCDMSEEGRMGGQLGNKGVKDVLSEALYSVITQLVTDVFTLPTPLVTFFREAQLHVSQKGISTPHRCLGIKVLAACLSHRLSDHVHVESLVGGHIPEELSDSVSLLAHCCYYTLTGTSSGLDVPEEASSFVRSNRNWVRDQVDILTEHFSNQAFSVSEQSVLDSKDPEFTENLLTNLASRILGQKGGEESLRKIHSFVQNNMSWICAQLDIQPLLGDQLSHSQSAPTRISLSLDPPPRSSFNPLTEYNSFSGCPLDQVAVAAFPWDWVVLLSSDLGLSESGFRHLLFNRHEMQDSAFLEEQERKPVEALRKRFHADSPEL